MLVSTSPPAAITVPTIVSTFTETASPTVCRHPVQVQRAKALFILCTHHPLMPALSLSTRCHTPLLKHLLLMPTQLRNLTFTHTLSISFNLIVMTTALLQTLTLMLTLTSNQHKQLSNCSNSRKKRHTRKVKTQKPHA